VRIFPNVASCLRLTRALCAETHEAWLEDNRYINTDLLREERKEAAQEGSLSLRP
jgi:transposase-like protein